MASPSVRPWGQVNIPTGSPVSTASADRWRSNAYGSGVTTGASLYNQMTQSLPGLNLQYGRAQIPTTARQPSATGGNANYGTGPSFSHGRPMQQLSGGMSLHPDSGPLKPLTPEQQALWNQGIHPAAGQAPGAAAPVPTAGSPAAMPPADDGMIYGGGKTAPLDPLARVMKDSGAQLGRQYARENLATLQELLSTEVPKAHLNRYKLDQDVRLAQHAARAREKDIIRDWKRAKKYRGLSIAQLLDF